MLSTLARKLGITLLAIVMLAAPVVGAQPRCCKTGAIKGSGQCCCGPQAVNAPASSCCQRETRPCCAQEEESSAPTAVAVWSDAPCHCRASTQPPAIAGAKHGSEISLETFVGLIALDVPADDASQTFIARGLVPVAGHRGTSLHKVHCRWTI